MGEREERFQLAVLPHLNAAYNLARWLTGNEHDARDVVQEACVRALRAIDALHSVEAARPWLMAIVRNTTWTWLRTNRPAEITASLEDTDLANLIEDDSPDPQMQALQKLDHKVLNDAVAALPVPFRETLLLRELEELSYHDIARITGVPIGTVMSRLARARKLLAQSFHVLIAHAESGGRR